MANFNHDNLEQIEVALDRYNSLLNAQGHGDIDRLSSRMDLCAADGVNGNSPLDWDRLLEADDSNFLHDMIGIERHMDRVTCQIMGFFRPRFAVSKNSDAA